MTSRSPVIAFRGALLAGALAAACRGPAPAADGAGTAAAGGDERIGAACTPATVRQPPALPPSPAGTRFTLDDARLFVPDAFAPAADGRVPLVVHFQGGANAAEALFAASGVPGVLIASTLAGRSSAFAKPYADPRAFAALLAAGERELAARCGRTVAFAPIVLTFFSAGYGAVREILQQPAAARIAALVAADSIYAGVVPGTRTPDPAHMAPFVAFARRAARGEVVFVVAHSRIATDYAGTHECAGALLESVGLAAVPADRCTARGVPIAREAHRRGLHVYDFDEATPGIHVDLLHALPELLEVHVAPTIR